MPLSRKDKHFWYPVPVITEWLASHVIPANAFVVDVGCGHNPFPRADVGIDQRDRSLLEIIWKQIGIEPKLEVLQWDVTERPLPYGHKDVDFVYCRHMLEDMGDPFPLIAELQRVGKAGYIETPSPLVELVRGADGVGGCEIYRGYYHHRWFIWVHDDVLNFVEKLPVVEHFKFGDEDMLEEAVKRGPELWNTYFLWDSEIKWKRQRENVDFAFIDGYLPLLWRAAEQSAMSTDAFCRVVKKQMEAAV